MGYWYDVAGLAYPGHPRPLLAHRCIRCAAKSLVARGCTADNKVSKPYLPYAAFDPWLTNRALLQTLIVRRINETCSAFIYGLRAEFYSTYGRNAVTSNNWKSDIGKRSGGDRRVARDRRCGLDTRYEEEKRAIGERRANVDRRSGMGRRASRTTDTTKPQPE